jgi:hypothetical protein
MLETMFGGGRYVVHHARCSRLLNYCQWQLLLFMIGVFLQALNSLDDYQEA